MKSPSLSLCALFACFVMLAACSQAPGPSRLQYTPNVVSGHKASPLSSYASLYSFTGEPDGSEPAAGVLHKGGLPIYGTTSFGGAKNAGTVFSFSGGTETVLHSFGGTDGVRPLAGLIAVNGTLYGTTNFGGGGNCVGGCGVVFSITTDGHETVLHSFGYGIDGIRPEAGLRNVNGTLYGTTVDGGAYGDSYNVDGFGTVFSITTDGSETVLHSFGNGDDGRHPESGLRNVNGMGLVGTTPHGGVDGRGTIFELTP